MNQKPTQSLRDWSAESAYQHTLLPPPCIVNKKINFKKKVQIFDINFIFKGY